MRIMYDSSIFMAEESVPTLRKVEDRTIIREPRVYVRAKHANSLQIGKGRNRRACSTGTHLWVIFATNETVATSAHGF